MKNINTFFALSSSKSENKQTIDCLLDKINRLLLLNGKKNFPILLLLLVNDFTNGQANKRKNNDKETNKQTNNGQGVISVFFRCFFKLSLIVDDDDDYR